MLNVCEIFYSLQGEGTHSGLPCTIIRLAGCNLHCRWCDSSYALQEGMMMNLDDILRTVESYEINLVMITGGEPLLQQETKTLTDKLLLAGYRVLINTNGSYSLESLPVQLVKMIDIKCPGSGEESSFLLSNIDFINHNDEVNFVISDRKDFEWAVGFIETNLSEAPCMIRFTPAFSILPITELAEWIMETKAKKIRLGIQLHKIIWGEKRGV